MFDGKVIIVGALERSKFKIWILTKYVKITKMCKFSIILKSTQKNKIKIKENRNFYTK